MAESDTHPEDPDDKGYAGSGSGRERADAADANHPDSDESYSKVAARHVAFHHDPEDVFTSSPAPLQGPLQQQGFQGNTPAADLPWDRRAAGRRDRHTDAPDEVPA